MTTPDSATHPNRKIAVIAGSGTLPAAVIETLRLNGRDPLVVLVEGEADSARAVAGDNVIQFQLEDAGALVGRLRKAGVSELVLAGGIMRRPRIGQFRWSLGLLKMLAQTIKALRSGDDGLLSAVISHFSQNGIQVLGAHEVVPDLLARHGTMTARGPTPSEMADIEAGLRAARTLGALDIGQAAISVGGRVVALEGIEGTDGLLDRMVALRSHPRIAEVRGGVLVKCMKPAQDRRADLPAIGPRTVADAHRAGLTGIAVEAGKSFVLGDQETIAEADRLGLFIHGFGEDGR